MSEPARKQEHDPGPDPALAKKFYRDMLLIRRFEEKAGQLYGMGLIGGFCHLYIGQEAVVVGMQAALEAGRSGHHRLSRPRPHAGRGHGPEGRDGGADRPRHRLFQGQGRLDAHVLREKRFYGGHGIVGAQVPIGTGLAFANKYREKRRGVPHLFRRRRRQPGAGVRELQHGGAVEAARRLHHREQPIRHGHQRGALQRDGANSTSAALRSTFPASRWTAWMWKPCTRPAQRPMECAPRAARGRSFSN